MGAQAAKPDGEANEAPQIPHPPNLGTDRSSRSNSILGSARRSIDKSMSFGARRKSPEVLSSADPLEETLREKEAALQKARGHISELSTRLAELTDDTVTVVTVSDELAMKYKAIEDKEIELQHLKEALETVSSENEVLSKELVALNDEHHSKLEEVTESINVQSEHVLMRFNPEVQRLNTELLSIQISYDETLGKIAKLEAAGSADTLQTKRGIVEESSLPGRTLQAIGED